MILPNFSAILKFERRQTDMPSFTRKAIMEAFLKILDEKPLGKITIRDIVDE